MITEVEPGYFSQATQVYNFLEPCVLMRTGDTVGCFSCNSNGSVVIWHVIC